MKIAIILSGELRSYKKCYPNFKKYFIDDVNNDIDIFVAVWKQVGKCNKNKNQSVRKHDRIIDRHDNENHVITDKEIIELYKPKKYFLKDYLPEYKDILEGLYRPNSMVNSHNKSGKSVEIVTNTNLPMFYMMKKGLELKKQYENENNFKYDIVLRIRPDINPFPINWNKYIDYLKKDILVVFPICYPVNLSDKFAFGNSKIMDFYLSTWDDLEQYWYPNKFENPKPVYKNIDTKDSLDIKFRHCEKLMYFKTITEGIEFIEVNNYEDFNNNVKHKPIKKHNFNHD